MHLLPETLRPSLPDGIIWAVSGKTAKLHLDRKLWPESMSLNGGARENAFQVCAVHFIIQKAGGKVSPLRMCTE